MKDGTDTETSTEESKPEIFIQDRVATNSVPEHGDRFVLSVVYENGDVDNVATGNNPKELEKTMEDWYDRTPEVRICQRCGRQAKGYELQAHDCPAKNEVSQ